jgi:hypothetical protein
LASNARLAARPRRTRPRIATDADARSKVNVFVELVATDVVVEFPPPGVAVEFVVRLVVRTEVLLAVAVEFVPVPLFPTL